MTKEESLVMIDLEMRNLLETDDDTTSNNLSYLGLLRIVRRDIEAGNSSYEDFRNHIANEFEKACKTLQEDDTLEKRKEIIINTFNEVRKKYDHTK